MAKRTMKLLLALIAMLALVNVTAIAQNVEELEFPKLSKLEVPEVEKITLDNGMRLYLLEDASLPVFDISVRINGGSYLEPGDKVGLASICGSVMRTGGTTKWSGDEIDEILEGIGGSVETGFGLSSGFARVNVLSEYTELGVEVLAEVLRNPIFDEDKIELAKVQERSSISRRNDDPMQICIREYRKLIYGNDSPYARHTEYATVNAVSRDDLLEFHGMVAHPQNVQMAIWGDFKKSDVLSLISKYFGDWKQGGDPIPPMPEVEYDWESGVYYAEKTDVNQSNVLLGHLGGLTTDDDYAARIVMNNILGGSFGSRLFNSVRSREGLAYSVFGVYTSNITYPGVFYNFASTKSESTVKAARAIISEVKRMQTDKPTEKEMRMGKDGYLNSFVFNFDTKSEVVNRLMNYDFHGLPEDFLFQEKERVEKVTPDDVMAAAQKNLRPDAFKVLVVGKSEDFGIPLDEVGYGSATQIDITIPSGEEESELAVTPENLAKGAELLAAAVEAHGGLDKFKAVTATHSKGQMTISTPQGDLPLSVEEWRVLPDKSCNIISMMGQNMYSVRNGSVGWKPGQMGDVQPMTEEDLIEADKELWRNLIYLFKNSDNPDLKVVYDGLGNVGGTDVEFFVVLDKDGENLARFGICTKTKMVASRSHWGETFMGEGNVTSMYLEFQEANGISVPMKTEMMFNGQKFASADMTQYEVNPEVPAGQFDEPK